LALALPTVQATAAEIKLLAGGSMRVLLPELLPQFEKSSGHKVTIEYGTLGANKDRVMKGEGDVAIVTGAHNDELLKQGKLLAGSRADLAKVGYGVFVKAGGAKPDLASVDAFKRTILAAKTIALGDPAGGGPVGVFSGSLMQRLGLADEVKAKTKLFPSGTEVAEAVAKGQTEIGLGLASDAVIVPSLVAVPLPTEIQNYTIYTLGVVASSSQVDAAKALVAFLISPAAKQALAAKGFDPQ
jgi:molybdate transport system substrate-binding protein